MKRGVCHSGCSLRRIKDAVFELKVSVTELTYRIKALVNERDVAIAKFEKAIEQRDRARNELVFGCQYPNCRTGTCQMLERYGRCRTLIALADEPLKGGER